MKLSDFDYHLPPELIAQVPAHRRDKSRLVVLDRQGQGLRHGKFRDLVDYLSPGDALVVNDTRVFKARLIGNRASGGKVEIFLVRPVSESGTRWLALAAPSRRLKAGENILFAKSGSLKLVELRGEGYWEVEFAGRRELGRIQSAHGHVPLPHYIEHEASPTDLRRYQTVYADPKKKGAVAAPTAGFHFTKSLLEQIEGMGVHILKLTLHVGPGTFKPITADRVEDHIVDPEFAEITQETADRLSEIRSKGGKTFAVGTTTTRTLESAQIVKGRVRPFHGMVDLYIKPGHRFRLVDHLITNFHLPKSSLLVLVSALAGREQILQAYSEAISSGYRFYSYGDAMLIL